MKKTLLMVVGLMVAATVVYAQAPNAKPAANPSSGKTIATLIERAQGKIESLQKADDAKGNFGKLSIMDVSGKKKDFSLIAKTQVHSKNSALINFSDLKKGQDVIVLYVVTLKGVNDVITVMQVN